MSAMPGIRSTVEELFAGRPDAGRLFALVLEYIETLGPVTVSVTKTQVAFGVRRQFAWVWLPQMWIRERPDSTITLAFAAEHRIEDPLIAAAAEPRPGRWTHHVLIDTPADLDEVVRGWLRQACLYGAS
jgi:hypothetical protein